MRATLDCSSRVLGVVAAISLLASCVQDADALPGVGAPTSVRVTVRESDRGSSGARKPFTLEPEPLTVTFEVVGASGARDTSFDGWLAVRMEPGDVARVVQGGTTQPGPNVKLTAGIASDVQLFVSRGYSDARVWAEDIGYAPGEPAASACGNGMDDDADGSLDFPGDSGCAFANDDDETSGSHAAGVSDFVYFANPRLGDLQGYSGVSTLQGRLVTVSDGQMIVTRITTDGFYVSEIEVDEHGTPTGRAVPWGSIFVFNFNSPPFLRACDRILQLSGSIGEFFGFTELNQPSWRREKWCPPMGDDTSACIGANGQMLTPQACPIPEPAIITDGLLGTPDMEALESSLVRVVGAKVASRFSPEPPPMGSNCDLDGNGDVELGSTTPEGMCNNDCARDPTCSEWNTYEEFGQFVVQVGSRTMNVVTRDSVPDFDPLAYRGMALPAITGTLRNFSPLGSERGYILEPRCQDDITLPGQTPMSDSTACVVARTGGEIEPD